MRSLRFVVAVVLCGAAAGCSSDLCARSSQAATKIKGDCPSDVVSPLLGAMCSANLSKCTEADQKLLENAVACEEKLPACSALAKDAWRLQQDGCSAALIALTTACVEAFPRRAPADAGVPDAGPQTVSDGGNGVLLVGAANADTVALAWSPLRKADVAKYLLIETDALGDNRTETEISPGTTLQLTVNDAGMSGRRYFLAGVNAAGEVLIGQMFGTEVFDAGSGCQNNNQCADDKVCDLGQCKSQSCVPGGVITCPSGYTCFPSADCHRLGDGGVFNPGGMRDAGSQPAPMISNEIALTPRPPVPSMLVPVGTASAHRPRISAIDTARMLVVAEQEGQLIAHASRERGADLIDEGATSFGLDTSGTRVHLAWHPETRAVFACYPLGRGVRVQRSDDWGRTWGRTAVTFEPPLSGDGGIGDVIRDCDIAPWKNGGSVLVTTESEQLIVRELSSALEVVQRSTAFTSTPPDAGAGAVFTPTHPAIAAHIPSSSVYVTFTGNRLLTGGALDTEPYGLAREGGGSFTLPSRLTPSAQASALPEDWTAVAVNPTTGRPVAAFTTVVTGTQASTVFLALYNPTSHAWGTGSHLNVFALDPTSARPVLFPDKPQNETWFAFSPQLVPMPNGLFALSFVAGPRDGQGVTTYRQYLIPVDLERVPAITAGRGWFVPPVMKISDARVLDPRGSLTAPQPPVTSLASDTQISVYGVFVEGAGPLGDIEGPAQTFHWP